MKRKLNILIYIVFLFIVLETFSRLFLSTNLGREYTYKSNSENLFKYALVQSHFNQKLEIEYLCDIFDPYRGWALKPNLRNISLFDHKTVNSNSKGLRGVREYNYQKILNRKRILILGDSFTFGDEVNDNETYPYILQQIFPEMEILNFGVHGYGHDQMLIYLKDEGLKYHPDYVILAFVSWDLERNVLEFRDFSKPKFELLNNNLILKNFPVHNPEDVFKKEYHRSAIVDLLISIFQAYEQESGIQYRKETRITTAILDEMVKAIHQVGAKPIFVYLPTGDEISDSSTRLTFGEKFLYGYSLSRGVDYLSLRNNFAEYARKTNLKTEGHWDPKEHKIAAEAIAAYIKFILNQSNYIKK